MCRQAEEFEIVQLEDELDRLVEQQRDLTHQEQGRQQKKIRIQKEILELRDVIAKNPLDAAEVEKSLRELREKRVKREEAINRQEQLRAEVGKNVSFCVFFSEDPALNIVTVIKNYGYYLTF